MSSTSTSTFTSTPTETPTETPTSTPTETPTPTSTRTPTSAFNYTSTYIQKRPISLECVVLKQQGFWLYKIYKEFSHLHGILGTQRLELVGILGNDYFYADADAYAKAKEKGLHTNAFLPHVVGDCLVVGSYPIGDGCGHVLTSVSDETRQLLNEHNLYKAFYRLD